MFCTVEGDKDRKAWAELLPWIGLELVLHSPDFLLPFELKLTFKNTVNDIVDNKCSTLRVGFIPLSYQFTSSSKA